MKPHNRFLAVCLTVLLAQIPGLSQDNSPQPVTDKQLDENSNPEIRSCLRKIVSGSFELDLDIDVDQETLESDIEMAIDNAMRSAEIVLEGLPVHLDLMKTDFSNMNMEFDPIDINLRDVDIDIEPVEFDMDDFDINIDYDGDDFRFDDDAVRYTTPYGDDTSHEQTKMNSNDNSKEDPSSNKEKSKGLKKIN